MDQSEFRLARRCAELLELSYLRPTMTEKNEQIRVSRDDDGVWVAVSGSNDMVDWIQNLTGFRPLNIKNWWSFHKTIPGTSNKATWGYVNAGVRVAAMVEAFARRSDPIHLCGHSAGGPKAAIAGILLRDRGFRVEKIRTFGAPRFSIEKILNPALRGMVQYVARGDVIPDYPRSSEMRPWQHQGEVFRFGVEPKDHFGIVRDIVQAVKYHMMLHYHRQMEDLLIF